MKYKDLYSIFSASPFCSKRNACVAREAWPYHAFTLDLVLIYRKPEADVIQLVR
jgi:hypothetical protein